MANSLFDNIFAGSGGVAETLLKSLGLEQGGKVILKPCESYDPKTGKTYKSPEEKFTVNSSPPLGYKLSEIDDTNILHGDLFCFIGASDLKRDISSVDPDRLIQSKFEINGLDLRIINADPIYSGELISAFKLQLRKAD